MNSVDVTTEDLHEVDAVVALFVQLVLRRTVVADMVQIVIACTSHTQRKENSERETNICLPTHAQHSLDA